MQKVKNVNKSKANQINGAEALVRMLEAYEVNYIFGLCGDTSLPFYDALFRLDHGINHVLTRDERSAAYMADGYARVTNKVGVCEGPSGGGATYIVPGVVEANESSSAILAITSDVATTSIGHYPLTELDQTALFKPLTKWNGIMQNSGMVPMFVNISQYDHRTLGAAHLGFPIDSKEGQLTWIRFGRLSHAASRPPKRPRSDGNRASR